MTRTVIGGIFTAIWFAVAVAVYLDLREPGAGLNEIGGFLSGVVAPIAFMQVPYAGGWESCKPFYVPSR